MAPADLEALPLEELPTWLEESPRKVPGAALEAAEATLEAMQGGRGPAPSKPVAKSRKAQTLADELCRELPRAADAVADHGAEGVATWLEEQGRNGRKAAESTRVDGYALPVARLLRRMSWVLWLDKVGPRLEEEAIRRYPGLPLPLVERGRVGAWGRPRAADTPEHGRVLVDGAGTMLAWLEPDRVPSVSPDLLPNLEAWERNGAKLLGTLHAHRLIRWLAWEAHTRQHYGHAPILEVEGGWPALARMVGSPSGKAPDKLRDIVWCLDAHRFTFPDGGLGRLLTVHRYQPPRGPGRHSRISLLPGAPLLPGYLFELRRPMRKSVPVLAELPPMVGRERDHGAVAELHWRVLVDMRRRCREMVGDTEGVDLGLPFPRARWRELGEQARVPSARRAEALERWTRDDSDGPAFLRRVDGDRFTLGPAHDGARRVLLFYGWKEATGSDAGKRSARARGNRGPNRRRRGRR